MENQPTLAYVCQKRTRAGPKMGMDPGLACPAAQDCAQMGPGVKHPPKVTQNGHRVVFTRRNRETRHVLSLPCAGAGDQAASRDGVGCPKKLMPGVMPWRWNIARYADPSALLRAGRGTGDREGQGTGRS